MGETNLDDLALSGDLAVGDDITLAKESAIIIGAQANTSGSGHPLTASDTGTVRVFSDDGGASIADSVRGVQSRLLLTVDQTGGSIRALQGQLKMATGVDVTSGIYTAVQGYVEMAGTHSTKTGSTHSCIDASLEIGTALTVDSGGEFYGLHVETTGAGTITNNGTCAAIGITQASGAADWPVGLYVQGAAVTTAVSVGAKANTAGSGVTIPSTDDWGAVRIFADDAGANIADSTRVLQSRMLLTIDQSAGSLRAIQGQVKWLAGIDSATGVYTAVQGYNEFAGATSVQSGAYTSCFDASTELAAGTAMTVDSGGYYFGMHVETTGTGTITNNGVCAALGVTKASGAATWPAALYVNAADYLVSAPTGTAYECGFKIGSMTGVGGGDGNTADGLIRVQVGSTAYYIALYAAANVTGE